MATYLWMLLPAALIAAFQVMPQTPAFWRDAALAGLFDALGNLAMVAALRSTDLSLFGPLNALRPLLALVFGWVFLGEHPTVIGLAGIGVTAMGAAWLLAGDGGTGKKLAPRRTAEILGLRFGGLALSSVGAVFLKRAADQGGSGWTLAIWVAAGSALLAIAAFNRGNSKESTEASDASDRDINSGGQGSPRFPSAAVIALHAALFLAMQWATVVIFRGALLAYSFVFFQLGMILQVIVGRVVFGEPAFAKRLAACLIMAAGAGLILWKG